MGAFLNAFICVYINILDLKVCHFYSCVFLFVRTTISVDPLRVGLDSANSFKYCIIARASQAETLLTEVKVLAELA